MPVSVKRYNEKYYYYGSTGSQTAARESINNIKKKTDDIIKQNSDTYNKDRYSEKTENKEYEDDEEDLTTPKFIRDNKQQK